MHRFTCKNTQIHIEFRRKFEYLAYFFSLFSVLELIQSSPSSLTMCFFSLSFCLFNSQAATHRRKKEKCETPPTTKTTAANLKCGIEPKEIVCFRLLRIGSWRVLAQLREVIKTSVTSTLVSFVIVCAKYEASANQRRETTKGLHLKFKNN